MFIRTERSLKEFIYAYPIVTSLIIINLFLWLIIFLFPFGFAQEIYNLGAGSNYMIYAFDEYWRFVTPIFLHSRQDIMHVLFNSFALVLFGPALEQMLGRLKFITAYLVMGIAGNVGTYFIDLYKISDSNFIDPLSFTLHVGASGAIYGLFGIYIYMILYRKSLIDQTNAQIVVTIFLIGLVMTFLTPQINIAGHIFGFIGGFAIAPFMLINAKPFSIYRNKRPPVRHKSGDIQFDPNRWEKKRFIPRKLKKNIIWIVLGILVLLGLLGRFI